MLRLLVEFLPNSPADGRLGVVARTFTNFQSERSDMSTVFAQKILQWFNDHGRHDLPWQQDKTAYRVWVSEIMLQQTQVKTVIPYYLRFIQRFPTIQVLATSTIDEVLHHWTGLGYYSRARHLHATAKKVMADFAGIFPHTLKELQTLPGIGRSTAGAIASIAFQIPTPILDGNVKRVLARFHGITEVITDKAIEKQLWQHATAALPTEYAADYTQAMMDLGATLCTRTKPLCLQCPLHGDCLAFNYQLTHLIPKKAATKILPVKATTFIIFKSQGCVLLHKRNEYGIWGGLWCFPEITGPLQPDLLTEYCLTKFNLSSVRYQKLLPFRHTFSHYHLDIVPVIIELTKPPSKVMESEQVIWYNLQQPAAIGLPKPIIKIVEELANDTTTSDLLQ